MRWFSIFMIYGLFWVLTAFIVLPFGLRTPHEDKDSELVEGQADSAPTNFRPLRVIAWTTAISLAAFVLFYANYVHGWLTFADIDYTRRIKP
ncbi:MAG: DUF1467 family protein [Sphingomonadales bacterium]|nr:DUF1467 family protein [Sphingomonadales bacterium]MDE2568887.1 DUF1467 family protein [Sphingomonadales bacterium]